MAEYVTKTAVDKANPIEAMVAQVLAVDFAVTEAIGVRYPGDPRQGLVIIANEAAVLRMIKGLTEGGERGMALSLRRAFDESFTTPAKVPPGVM